jgi:dethiobiotin synthetase
VILFITGTGTGVGKTWLTRGLARAIARRTQRVLAIKPIETGDGTDAQLIARAAGHGQLEGFYRAHAPLAPLAAVLEGEVGPDLDTIVHGIRALEADVKLVEGAGGLLSPLDSTRDNADLAASLAAPLLLVARDELGVLSALRTTFECADARGLAVRACVLTRGATLDDSTRTNTRILEAKIPRPILTFAPVGEDDDALADAAEPLLSRTLPGL